MRKELNLDAKFKMGKYRNHTVDQVLRLNPDYLIWYHDHVRNQSLITETVYYRAVTIKRNRRAVSRIRRGPWGHSDHEDDWLRFEHEDCNY